jgi:DNA replication and repair protein RecF
LIEEGSARRRRLLDWGVFHVKHQFLSTWRRYQRALRQRNAALRTGGTAEVIEAWEMELATSGVQLDQHRAAYVDVLRPHFERIALRLLRCEAVLGYRRGWAAEADLDTALRDARPRDIRLKATSQGAHRADLTFRIDGQPARDRVSRGQQKMLASALILAQVELRASIGTNRPCLLLDDPAAELDVDNLGRLLGVINEIPAQIVATSVTNSGLKGMKLGRMFHVEQGDFAPML